MKTNCTILIALFIPLFTWCQLHDNIWILGYGGGPESAENDSFGLSILDFRGEALNISNNQEGEAWYFSNNACHSNKSGNLLFSFTGDAVFGANHQIIQNGHSWFNGNLSNGSRYPQSALFLEHPGDSNLVFLINMEVDVIEIEGESEFAGDILYYSIIDKTLDNGNGAVTIRKETLLNTPMDVGKLSTCKHANGRDWWLVVPAWSSNLYYRFLLSPEGITELESQVTGDIVPTGLGQALFSPDGTKHIRYNGISQSIGEYVTVYDFDRCSGLLSNFQQINLPQGGVSGGTAVSKNSRFLYTTSNIYIYQYDLQATDILATRTLVAEYDGFADPFSTTFFQAQMALDGKIYISAANGVRWLHVIQNPNELCPDCNIQQHGIELPTHNAFSIPNMPNYRLGPIDGSPCDTLGIDNLPLARWRYTQDTLEPLEVFFTDLSDYEPTEWFWDFGDGFTSTEQNPTHFFGEVGTYEVCLTVSNENSNDTQCKTLTFEIVDTNTEAPTYEPIAQVFPNPFQRYLSFSLRKDWLPVDTRVVVYDAVGRMVQNRQLATGMNTLDMGGASAGIYFYQISEAGNILQQGKVVKQ